MEFIANFTIILVTSAANSTPDVCPKHSLPWLLSDILRLIKNRNYYRRLLYKYRCADYVLLNNWTNAVKAVFSTCRNQSCSNKIRKLDSRSKAFCNIVKYLRKRNASILLFTVNNEVLFSNADKCGAFSDHFLASHMISANLSRSAHCSCGVTTPNSELVQWNMVRDLMKYSLKFGVDKI